MRYAPIVLFVYNRADHFRSTYAALAKCEGARESDLYIFSDGPKDQAGREKVEEVRKEAYAIENSGSFHSVEVIESDENRGLAQAVITGVTKVLEEYGRVIVLEDDCIASPHLLTYMNRCLDLYESDKKIGSVAGYAPQMAKTQDNQSDIFLARRSCSMTWATWSDRWENIDWTRENIVPFYQSRTLRRILNSNGTDRFLRLYRQSKGKGNSWSISFGAHHAKNDWWVIYPKYSYVQNIGCDNTGVHSDVKDAASLKVNLSKAIANPNIQKPMIDKKIQKELGYLYSGNWVRWGKQLIAIESICLLYKMGMLRK